MMVRVESLSVRQHFITQLPISAVTPLVSIYVNVVLDVITNGVMPLVSKKQKTFETGSVDCTSRCPQIWSIVVPLAYVLF